MTEKGYDIKVFHFFTPAPMREPVLRQNRSGPAWRRQRPSGVRDLMKTIPKDQRALTRAAAVAARTEISRATRSGDGARQAARRS